jgi:quercetin dioxygenase-like cupin family protein
MNCRSSPSGRGIACGLIMLTAGLLAGKPAAAQSPANHGVRVTPIFSQKMPNVPGKTMTAVAIEYDPGGGSAPHRHPASGMVFVYVVAGTVRSQVEGEPVKVFHAGETWSEPPNAHHILAENASASDPARLISVVVADDGVPTTVYDK